MNLKSDVQKFAMVIENVLKVDVTIADDEFKRVAGTGKYMKLIENGINEGSVFAKAINTGNSYFVKNPRKSDLCVTCSFKRNCRESAEVCCPIVLKGKSIGAIGLIAFGKEQRDSLLINKDSLQQFLYQMADLIASKAYEREILVKNMELRKQLETMIDSIDEGIITVNMNGIITRYNHPISEMLGVGTEDIIGVHIGKIFSELSLNSSNNLYKNINNKEFVIKENGTIIRGLMSARDIISDSECIGTVFIIRELSDIRTVINDISGTNPYISFDDIIGNSKAIMEVKEKAQKVAKGISTVLIMGESGTGKEMFARAIHNASFRRGKPFVAINCAAIPEGLLESELFGYEEGAFTGARKGGKIGKFEIANGGTIFLDEIGDMQLHMQTKILRVLQERSIERIGGQYSIPIDVRVITATHKDLNKMVREGEFRNDLFYRLNVIPLIIPPLRERKEDIPLIMRYMLQKCNSKLNKSISGFSDEVNDILLNYYWPGNIRELENTIEYALNMETGNFIGVNSLPSKFKQNSGKHSEGERVIPIQTLEKEAILNVLNIYGYSNKTEAAKAIGMSRATFYRKLKEYDIISK